MCTLKFIFIPGTQCRLLDYRTIRFPNYSRLSMALAFCNGNSLCLLRLSLMIILAHDIMVLYLIHFRV